MQTYTERERAGSRDPYDSGMTDPSPAPLLDDAALLIE
jgi:hypothetical protein